MRESTILSLYGRIRVSENPYSHIFYAVVVKTFKQFSEIISITDPCLGHECASAAFIYKFKSEKIEKGQYL